ncbi:MAG: hypothetical protein DRH15_10885, partial [Deltaproteobacteria bacterium]
MSTSFRVKFEPAGIVTEQEPGTTIGEIASQLNVPIRADCGGKGLCGKCKVIVEPSTNVSPLTEPELDILSPDEIKKSFRLACQAQILGDVTVTIPEQMADSREARGKTGVKGRYPLAPMVERIVLGRDELPEPKDSVLVDVVSWVTGRAAEVAGHEVLIEDLGALRQLSRPGVYDGEITLVNHLKRGVTAVLPGSRIKSLGLAVDIGTTTLAAYLCDLHTGEVIASSASVNPQRRHGEDVISRIAMADGKEDGLEVLQGLVVEG